MTADLPKQAVPTPDIFAAAKKRHDEELRLDGTLPAKEFIYLHMGHEVKKLGGIYLCLTDNVTSLLEEPGDDPML